MDKNCLDFSADLQKAAFEAIKAKLKNIHSHFTPNDNNSLQLELAEMIYLLSAQLVLLNQISPLPGKTGNGVPESRL